jgi:hypothetical protein
VGLKLPKKCLFCANVTMPARLFPGMSPLAARALFGTPSDARCAHEFLAPAIASEAEAREGREHHCPANCSGTLMGALARLCLSNATWGSGPQSSKGLVSAEDTVSPTCASKSAILM